MNRNELRERIKQAIHDSQMGLVALLPADAVLAAISDAGCTIVPDGPTVGMTKELVRGLGIEDADAHFRAHIDPLKRAIAASPFRDTGEE